MKREKLEVERGSGNVFRDLGHEKADIDGCSNLEHQVGDETVHPPVVAQRVAQEEAEGTGVIQRGLEDRGIFREHVLVISTPQDTPRFEQLMESLRVLRVTEKRLEHLRRKTI